MCYVAALKTVAFTRVLVRPPATTPYLLILFYATCVIAALYDLAIDVFDRPVRPGAVIRDASQLCVGALLVWLAGTYPLQDVWPCPNVAKPGDPSSNEYTMPEDSANLWTWSTFSFVEPLFKVSNSRRVNDEDVWTLSPFFTHKNLFRKYLQYTSEHPDHSLLRYLIRSSSLDLILDVALNTWSATIGFVPPYALQRILQALSDPSPNAKTTAYFFAVVAFLANLSFAQVDVNKMWFTRRCYERTRGQLFCALHYKALKRRDVSGKSTQRPQDETDEDEGNADLGKIVNLMQGDAYAVAYRFWQFSGFFLAPVRLTIALVYLYRILGWSAFAAVIVTIVVYLLNWPLATYDIYLMRQTWKASDRRMNTVNELFQNIRFLKFYGWEFRWSERVQQARENELRWRVKSNVVDVLIGFIWSWMPSATALVTFVCYTVVAKERLTVAVAFTAIALFSYLQGPMMELPEQVRAMLHAYVSMQRIEKFLAEPEVPDWATSLKREAQTSSSAEAEVGFENATFEWDIATDDAPSRFTLGPLDIKFPPGRLSLVSGPTGSGKSALLVAMLGEMYCTSGRVLLNKAGHQVAYCAQNPWLEHATVRDNIIYNAGYGYDEARYRAVIEACALEKDFEIFPAGDMTEIGEKGITLSGGQRARIALARALYSPAKVILLDDPLAAVDLHTAAHLVKTAFSGDLARNRTIILVTHHINLCLPIAAHLVELSSGTVLRNGSTADLRDRHELEKLVEAEDTVGEDATETSSATATDADVDNEADLGKSRAPSIHSSDKGKGKAGCQDGNTNAGKLVDEEARAEGRVSLRTYWTYIRAAGIICWISTFTLMLMLRFINVSFQFFLARWGEAYEKGGPVSELARIQLQGVLDDLPPPDEDVKPWLMIYLYISVSGALVVLLYISLGYYASLQAARSLFIAMLQRLSRAPSRFFDITPVGRILNRFTSDINTVDHALYPSASAALSGTLNFVISFVVVVSIVPAFAPFALFIAWLYVRLAPSYVRASRDLRRLESVSLSPAFAGFDELLRGLPHVRAFGMEERYQNRFYQRVDKFQSFDHVYWLIAGWLNWRYDCLGSVVVFMTTLFALGSSISSGYAALVIVQAGIFAEASRQLVRVLAQVELDFNSVERIVEYLEVPQEAPAVIQDKRPPAAWPSNNGELIVQDLVVKYAPHLPAVLKNISFYVKPAEKIGVVGRTGSGKSTLAMSLLRIVEPNGGHIIIDGIDITTIGLEDLRSRITIISQDVSLFSGTLRSNLDPFNEHTDAECWDVLERCHLTTILKGSLGRSQGSHGISLDMPISQTGSLSAGERQLVAMARAILRRSNLVILDEATSQIDTDLDDQIQRTVREEFAGAIVITIAHRLKTVLDYDRILVLRSGEILEFDSPEVLLRKSGGAFRDMCRASADKRVYQAASEAS
ncbi:P-loop containing nucleoside triphosphate hydrolase protein [Polyporus arcularius HHB13444]|uniref:P-loop containing nucleoside triphosphate hydrolase protein n=1 Tax=Polyporus arcularius HHB13444 TaxID=1314778 RepID=A0A5C3PVP7_9APHY|nr:P-loop containing nucleoside triphosphate hydrolase protein [Polyporus arcularius HHB13444]